jgi:hypothetical protein
MNLTERRQVVVDLLEFIRDFGQLDTTLLVKRTMDDHKFLEAAEAVLSSAVGPWRSVEALRDFCVHHLIGEKPLPRELERVRPRERVTPFSVPFALLRAMAPNPSQFDIHQLRTVSETKSFELAGDAAKDDRWPLRVLGDQAWLVTTMWGRTIGKIPHATDVEVTDVYANRIVHRGKLWALAAEAMPCFWWLPPNAELHTKLFRQRDEDPTLAILVVEGWCYQVR